MPCLKPCGPQAEVQLSATEGRSAICPRLFSPPFPLPALVDYTLLQLKQGGFSQLPFAFLPHPCVSFICARFQPGERLPMRKRQFPVIPSWRLSSSLGVPGCSLTWHELDRIFIQFPVYLTKRSNSSAVPSPPNPSKRLLF